MTNRVRFADAWVLPLLLFSVVAAPGLARADGATNDTLACYKWDRFPNERLNLNIRGGGPLSSGQDVNVFGYPEQRTSGIHAKHVGVCGEGTAAPLVGAMTVATGVGAHLGLHSAVTRGKGRSDYCRPVTIECISDEASKIPQFWTCQSRNEFNDYHGFSTLERVAIDSAPFDPLCAVFQDKHSFEDGADGEDIHASGTRAE